jgi:DNA-binding CsgD family transcriptional regulator/tetratricopeptide (TPR) repeat protein
VDWLIENGATELRLGPLDDDAVQQLCVHMLDASVDATVMTLAGRGRGNPFLLEQLLRGLNAAGQIRVSEGIATVVGDELPSSFLAAVQQRLRGLSAPALRLLDAGSVFGRAFTIHGAGRLCGIGPAELVGAANEAMAAGVLVEDDIQLDFAHDLLRQAVYGNMSGPARAAMHREAASVVRDEGCSAVEIAEHLLRAGRSGDRAAIEVLRRAAAEVAPRAPSTAADLIVRALDLVGERDDRRARLCADAVGLLASAGRLVEARDLGEAALRHGLDDTTEATLLLGLAEALKHAGQNRVAVDYTVRALARPRVADPVRARLHAIASHALLYVDDMPAADRAGAEADRLGRRTGEIAASVFGCTARSVVARAEGRLEDALKHARYAVELADDTPGEARHRHPRIWLGGALVALDRFDEAEAAYAYGRTEAERLGTGWSFPLWHFYRAGLLLSRADLDEAVAEAEAGLRVAEQLTARQLSVPILGLLARVAVLRAQMPLARDRLRRMRRLLSDGITAAPEDVIWAIATFEEADGKYPSALSTLADLYDRMPDRLLLLSNDPSAAPTLVRIALAAGAPERARGPVEAARALSADNPSVASLAGAAAHAEGLWHDDLDALRAAVDAFRLSPRRLARASALEDAGLAEHAAGDRARAVELLEEALDLCSTVGARRPVARLEINLRRLGVRLRPGVRKEQPSTAFGGLTRAELRVARLVAQGLTNGEVAKALVVSHHTVDSHLRSAFGKLGINSRVELTRLIVEHEGPSTGAGNIP